MEDGTAGDAPITAELLERLLASADPDAFLSRMPSADIDLADYLHDLRAKKGIGRADAIRAAGINATYGYEVFAGTKHPTRDYAIMLAFGLACTLDEAQHLLIHAGLAELWVRNRRDAVIALCLSRGMTREECDDRLYELGEATLLDAD